MINVVFNLTGLLSKITGIGNYSLNIARELTINKEIKNFFFYGFTFSNELKINEENKINNFISNIRNIKGLYNIRRFISESFFKNKFPKGKNIIYHEPGVYCMQYPGIIVQTVHDLSWIKYPQYHPIERVRYLNKHFEKKLNQVTRVITDSEFIKREIVKTFNINHELITTIPLGASNLFRKKNYDETRNVMNKYGLKHGMYWLVVGTIEPRKNIQLAVNSYSKFGNKIKNLFPLVIVGTDGWHTKTIEDLIYKGENKEYIKRLGFVVNEELSMLYSGAKALIYTSIYEGFGLPLIEAMSCGIPVIGVNTSSAFEIIKDAGIIVDPYDVDQLHSQMLKLLEDDFHYSDLCIKAFQRSLNFSWQKCALETINVYKKISK
jgi:alpha-1,3-rhamnosyl/mannosyltransferase